MFISKRKLDLRLTALEAEFDAYKLAQETIKKPVKKATKKAK